VGAVEVKGDPNPNPNPSPIPNPIPNPTPNPIPIPTPTPNPNPNQVKGEAARPGAEAISAGGKDGSDGGGPRRMLKVFVPQRGECVAFCVDALAQTLNRFQAQLWTELQPHVTTPATLLVCDPACNPM
jgi:hypothetical protein